MGEIVGTDLPGGPLNKLSGYGLVAEKHLENMKDFYENIKIDKYIIMPNHIHLILSIQYSGKRTVGTPVPTSSLVAKFIGTFKRFCNKEYGVNIWQSRSHDHVIRGKTDYQKIWEYMRKKWRTDNAFDVLVLDATVGDKDGDFRLGTHNSVPMLRLIVAALKENLMVKENTKIYASHLARTLHDADLVKVTEMFAEFEMIVANDGDTAAI